LLGNLEFVGSSADIIKRKQAEEKIRQSDVELRQILDFAPQYVAVLGPDRHRTRLYANQAALEYFGSTLEEWRSADRRKYYHPDDWERLTRETKSKFERGLPHEAEVRLLKKTGDIAGISSAGIPCEMNKDSSSVGMLRGSTLRIASRLSSGSRTKTFLCGRRLTRHRCSRRSWESRRACERRPMPNSSRVGMISSSGASTKVSIRFAVP
jgi:PAS domain-containing protein